MENYDNVFIKKIDSYNLFLIFYILFIKRENSVSFQNPINQTQNIPNPFIFKPFQFHILPQHSNHLKPFYQTKHPVRIHLNPNTQL